MKQTRGTGNSIYSQVRRLRVILVPLFVLYFLICVASIIGFRGQVKTYIDAFVDIYMEEIEDTVTNINRRMSFLILGEGESEAEFNHYIENIQTTKNRAYRNYFSNRLRDVFLAYSMEYGEEYHFFAYFPSDGQYVGANGDDKLSQMMWEEYRDNISHKLSEEALIPNSGSTYWQFVENEGDVSYIIKFYSIKDIYIGCWIRPEDMIKPLEKAVQNGKSSAFLFERDGTFIAGEKTRGFEVLSIERAFQNLPFRMKLVIHDYGLFQTTLFTQVGMLCLAFLILGVTVFCIYSLYQRVLKPIKKFFDNMERIRNGKNGVQEISESELMELEMANAEFRYLLGTVARLQNEVYEAEIKKQMIHMEYLKLQVEPHFYLNCLNFIYNAVDSGNMELARKMSIMTADYMRYLFHNGSDFVSIEQELAHIQRYLEIQKLRFERAFEFYIEGEEEVTDGKIPPLVIQTFVENCMKYAVDLEQCLRIVVTVYSEEINDMPYINICVTDSGPGYSREVLARLMNPEEYAEKEREHIGIANVLKRLYFIYGDKAQLMFYNGPAKGAVTEIHIPYAPVTEEGEE